MVDGADIGSEVNLETKDPINHVHYTELFRNADVICLVPGESTYYPDGGDDKGIKGRSAYGLFGNSMIIESWVPNKHLELFMGTNKTKIVLVNKKPYILNGELGASN